MKHAFPVYVGNLPKNVKRKRLFHLFSRCGKVLAIRIRTNSGLNIRKSSNLKQVPFLVAFVYFRTEKAAEASLKLSGQKVGENEIHVDRDLDKKNRKSVECPKSTIFVGNLKYGQLTSPLRLVDIH